MAIINTGDFPIDPTTTTGTDLADRLNRFEQATVSSHLNPTRPAYLKAGGVWAQSVPAGGYKLYFYDGTKDHEIGSVSAAGAGDFGSTPLAPVFSATATYTTGQVIYDPATGGYLQAKNAVAAGPYNPGDWQALTDVFGKFHSKDGLAASLAATSGGAIYTKPDGTFYHLPDAQQLVTQQFGGTTYNPTAASSAYLTWDGSGGTADTRMSIPTAGLWLISYIGWFRALGPANDSYSFAATLVIPNTGITVSGTLNMSSGPTGSQAEQFGIPIAGVSIIRTTGPSNIDAIQTQHNFTRINGTTSTATHQLNINYKAVRIG